MTDKTPQKLSAADAKALEAKLAGHHAAVAAEQLAKAMEPIQPIADFIGGEDFDAMLEAIRTNRTSLPEALQEQAGYFLTTARTFGEGFRAYVASLSTPVLDPGPRPLAVDIPAG